jgi:hypothetical protein
MYGPSSPADTSKGGINVLKSLILLHPDLSAGFDLERLKPLGSKAEVTRRIQSVLAGRSPVKVELGAEEPVRQVTVVIAEESAATFDPLRRLCDQTGWRLYDRDAGRFLDLTSARPLEKPLAAPPMFQWWTGLPSIVRVLVGLAVVFTIFYIYVLNWVLSWH